MRIADLAQLGERQTEVKLQELNLKVVCSIHTSRITFSVFSLGEF